MNGQLFNLLQTEFPFLVFKTNMKGIFSKVSFPKKKKIIQVSFNKTAILVALHISDLGEVTKNIRRGIKKGSGNYTHTNFSIILKFYEIREF